MAKPSDIERLEQLLSAAHPCIWIRTREEEHARQVVDRVASARLDPYWLWSCVQGLHPGLTQAPASVPNTENAAAALYHLARETTARCLCATFDLAGHLQDLPTLRALRELIERFRHTGSTLLMIDHADTLPDIVTAQAVPFELSLPGAEELEQLVKDTLRRLRDERQVEVTISKRDFGTVIRNLSGLTRRQAEQIIVDAALIDGRFDRSDINTVLARKRQRLHQDGLLQYIETPVDLSEIGGLERLKAWLAERTDALSEEAARFGIEAPRGVLLLGVQGAGKSLCAKAIATAWNRPLLRLDPGTLYDRYIGESERRLRSALHQVEMMAPIVLFIDEIEKGFAGAAAHSTDGGLSQRMFGTFLTWMQDRRAPVFLVATANTIEALPPELLRKGRFDEIFFVDLPRPGVRRQIFAIHLKKRGRDEAGFDLDALAAASEGYSGAEIEQAIIAALHSAFAQRSDIDTARVLAALLGSPPLSVTMAEAVHALRTWAADRCVPAD